MNKVALRMTRGIEQITIENLDFNFFGAADCLEQIVFLIWDKITDFYYLHRPMYKDEYKRVETKIKLEALSPTTYKLPEYKIIFEYNVSLVEESMTLIHFYEDIKPGQKEEDVYIKWQKVITVFLDANTNDFEEKIYNEMLVTDRGITQKIKAILDEIDAKND